MLPVLRNAAFSASRASMARSAAFYSTQTPKSTEVEKKADYDYKAMASKFIDSLPQTSFITKSGLLAGGVGALLYAIGNEYYVVSPETPVIMTFCISLAVVHKLGFPVVAKALDDHAAEVKRALETGRETKRAEMLAEIEKLRGDADLVEATKALFEYQRQLVQMKAQVGELSVQRDVHNKISSRLEHLAKIEAQARAADQADLVGNLYNRVIKATQDPKFREAALKKSLADLEALQV